MKIIKITPENKHLFQNINKENATVLFYHPSCIHCMMMRKNWEMMKQKLQQRKKGCNIYEVNGEHIDSIQHPLKDKVQGFPTIMNVKNGKLLNYFEKERNIENMLNYVVSNSNKPALNNIKKRNVSFSLKPNGSLMKSRKLLNSIVLRKKQMNSLKKRNNNTKKMRKPKKGNKRPKKRNTKNKKN